MVLSDTIAAISSPVGPCARIILRLSGPASHALMGELGGAALPPRGVCRLRLRSAVGALPATIYTFAQGASYTGQAMAEAHLPGNPLLADLLLRDVLARGARLAEPGEFTARAFFNHRLDLSEAEGVAETIAATSRQQLAAARRLQSGELTRCLEPVTGRLSELLALVETGIDFAEEDVTLLDFEQLRRRAAGLVEELDQLLQQSQRFVRLSHEPVIALCGRPNAGKSTLLNALCGSQRAVVSPVPGTTRDVISAQADLPRGRVSVVDAAGLEVEVGGGQSGPGGLAAAMRQKALEAIERADVVVLVREAQDLRPPIELPVLQNLTVLTKIDLLRDPQGSAVVGDSTLCVSAASGLLMPALRRRLDELAFGQSAPAEALALNVRHIDRISHARQGLGRVVQMRVFSEEILALELREALDALGEITGVVCPDEVLGRIFATFCIGK